MLEGENYTQIEFEKLVQISFLHKLYFPPSRT